MNVLSLFNGFSCGMMALEKLNIKVDKYFSSEIDKYANQATQALYPDVIQLGDVTKWQDWEFVNVGFSLGEVDLLLAGFPCQSWSMAGKQKGDNDPRGALVHDLMAIWNQINSCRKELNKPPVKFMFENVRMKKEFLEYINNLFGVEPVCINSALVSAQNRVRYYWSNIPGIKQPKDKGILLKDIIEVGAVDRDKSYCIDANYFKGGNLKSYFEKGRRQLVFPKCGVMRGRYIVDGKRADHTVNNMKCKTEQRIELRVDDKTNCLTTVQKDNLVVESAAERGRGFEVRKDGRANCLLSDGHQSRWLAKGGAKYRKLTPRECFRLQTVPEHHIETLLNSGISNSQLYKMAGNGWTVDVIAHIFKQLI